jgi:hypothetical protein
MKTKIIQCDYSNPEHQKAVITLIDNYIHDEMGRVTIGGNIYTEN